MKKIGIVILVVVLLVAGFMLTKNMIVKGAVTAGVKAVAGLDLSIKSMNVGILNSLIDIKELKLYNPSGYPDKLMVDMPEIYVDYDLGALLKKKMHFQEIRINLKEFVVVKNENGELNLDSLKVVQAKKEEKAPKETKEKQKMPELKIDVLSLKIGKVIYKDYSSGKVATKEFNVNIDSRYENITDPNALATIIITKALMNTTIASLANFDLGALSEGVGQTVGKVADTATGAVNSAGEAVKDSVNKATETINKILPFGK